MTENQVEVFGGHRAMMGKLLSDLLRLPNDRPGTTADAWVKGDGNPGCSRLNQLVEAAVGPLQLFCIRERKGIHRLQGRVDGTWVCALHLNCENDEECRGDDQGTDIGQSAGFQLRFLVFTTVDAQSDIPVTAPFLQQQTPLKRSATSRQIKRCLS